MARDERVPAAHAASPDTAVDWATLLKRVHSVDALACPCGGRLKFVELITEPTAAREVLANMGLPTRAVEELGSFSRVARSCLRRGMALLHARLRRRMNRRLQRTSAIAARETVGEGPASTVAAHSLIAELAEGGRRLFGQTRAAHDDVCRNRVEDPDHVHGLAVLQIVGGHLRALARPRSGTAEPV